MLRSIIKDSLNEMNLSTFVAVARQRDVAAGHWSLARSTGTEERG